MPDEPMGYTTCSSTSSEATLESIAAAVEQFERQFAKDQNQCDVLLVTREQWEQIKEQVPICKPAASSIPGFLHGLPVEVHDKRIDVLMRAWELWMHHGKRPGVIDEKS